VATRVPGGAVWPCWPPFSSRRGTRPQPAQEPSVAHTTTPLWLVVTQGSQSAHSAGQGDPDGRSRKCVRDDALPVGSAGCGPHDRRKIVHPRMRVAEQGLHLKSVQQRLGRGDASAARSSFYDFITRLCANAGRPANMRRVRWCRVGPGDAPTWPMMMLLKQL